MLFTAKEALSLDGLPTMDKAVELRSFVAGSFLMGSLRISKKSPTDTQSRKGSAPSVTASPASTPSAMGKPATETDACSKGSKPQAKTQSTATRSRAEALMASDSDLLERFTRIIGDRIEAGDDHGGVIDDALQSGNLYQWCCRQEGLNWRKIEWKSEERGRDDVRGKPFLVAGVQVGPKG